MRLLIDTRIFLKLANDPKSVPRRFRTAIDNADQRFFSVASVWEMTIKAARGKLALPASVADYMRNRMGPFKMTYLPISERHASAVETLPHLHGDPFDRMLIAQAIVENLTIVTLDRSLAAYPATVLK